MKFQDKGKSTSALCLEVLSWAEDKLKETGDDEFNQVTRYMSEIGFRCRAIETKLDTTIELVERYMRNR